MTAVKRFEGESIPVELLPIPAGWRVLVGKLCVEEITESGIKLPKDFIKGREYLQSVAKVLAVGVDCYKHPKFQGGIAIEQREPVPWVKVGDVVLIGQYSGQSVQCLDPNGKTQTLKLLNDDEILAVIPSIDVIDT